MGVDVQRGEAGKTDELHAPRLELVVMGHGMGYRKWIIDHQVFFGETGDAYSGAWTELMLWLSNRSYDKLSGAATGMKYCLPNGKELLPVFVFVDTGDAAMGRAAAVRTACHRIPNAIPCKGFATITAKSHERHKVDIPNSNMLSYRKASDESRSLYVQINTWHYKQELCESLTRPLRDDGTLLPNGISIFGDVTDEEMAQLCATERLEDGSYKDTRERVEMMDCTIYAMAAGQMYIDDQVIWLRDRARRMNKSPAALTAINSRYALEYLTGHRDPDAT
jgi:phage terminase large subunit GpA-like protein